jgi:hypothetical protein
VADEYAFTYVETLRWTEYSIAGAIVGHPAGEIIRLPLAEARRQVEELETCKYSTKQRAEALAAEQARRIAEAHAKKGEGVELVAVRLKQAHEKLNVGEIGFYPPARAAELAKAGIGELT